MEIWHNPRCSKSRSALAALADAGVELSERRYLDVPPTAAELDEVLTKLDLQPWDITRTGDPLAKELNVAALPRERTTWITLLADNPSLIQRPIIVTDDGRAIVARSPEAIDEALS